MSAVAFIVLLAVSAAPDDRLLRVEQAEFEATRSLATSLYETGKKYYLRGYRKEAIHFFKRCLEIRPRNGPIGRLASLLQDYDNPIWKKKRWRSPRAEAEKGFASAVRKLDERYLKALVKMGNHSWKYRKDERLEERAREHYRRALQLAGGPYELTSEGRLDLHLTSIPEEPSQLLLQKDLVRINGRLYLRDSMLRAISNVDSVCEARGEHVLIRTIDAKDLADRLLPLMEAARERYVEVTGQSPAKTLGLFVFPDLSTYQQYCRDSGNSWHQNASGFAHNGDGFAVTYVQDSLERLAVHEGSHLFHYFAFGSTMPSWYDEGFATSFGGEGTMRYEKGRLETHLPMATRRMAELKESGYIPLDQLLAGEAVKYLAESPEQGRLFYAQSWALYTYLTTTKDRRFRKCFDEWEGFALGSGFEKGANQKVDATALFGKIFEGLIPELESALRQWIEEQG